jgi:hypothetical protein
VPIGSGFWTGESKSPQRQDLNLSPNSLQAIAPLAVASIAKCAALQMRCKGGALNGSNWHHVTLDCSR